MSDVLITGATGFVGRHLAAALDGDVVGVGSADGDLRDAEAADRIVGEAAPGRVFHLAADASVADSWRRPLETIEGNVASTFNVLDAVRRHAPDARVLVAGSAEMYGPAEHVITEDEPPRPQNPYAVSKAAADGLAGFFADAHGIHVVRARAFNHAGPGQSDRYVVGTLARQIAAGATEVVTGDLRPRRDFTDVRDVVRAYVLLLEHAAPGAYNVCSGESVAIADILAGLARHAGVRVEQRTDPERVRAGEVMEIRGSHEKLTKATGWRPEIPLDRTLADTLEALR